MKRFFTIVLMLTSLSVSTSWAEEGTLVEIKELGFGIHKPVDWHFFQELNKPLGQDKPTLHSLLAHYAKTPVVAISKFPAQYAQDINPNIRVTFKPVNRTSNKKVVESQDPVQLLSGILRSLKPVLQNLKIGEQAKALNISGFHAAFARMSYTIQLVAGGQTRGNSNLWLVMPRSDYVFLISGVTREDEDNATREDLQAIVETITIHDLEN